MIYEGAMLCYAEDSGRFMEYRYSLYDLGIRKRLLIMYSYTKSRREHSQS